MIVLFKIWYAYITCFNALVLITAFKITKHTCKVIKLFNHLAVMYAKFNLVRTPYYDKAPVTALEDFIL